MTAEIVVHPKVRTWQLPWIELLTSTRAEYRRGRVKLVPRPRKVSDQVSSIADTILHQPDPKGAA